MIEAAGIRTMSHPWVVRLAPEVARDGERQRDGASVPRRAGRARGRRRVERPPAMRCRDVLLERPSVDLARRSADGDRVDRPRRTIAAPRRSGATSAAITTGATPAIRSASARDRARRFGRRGVRRTIEYRLSRRRSCRSCISRPRRGRARSFSRRRATGIFARATSRSRTSARTARCTASTCSCRCS